MSDLSLYDLLYKVILIGDSGVGKSNIISKYIQNDFNITSKPTIGVEFATHELTIDYKVIKVQIWDTAGQERYRAITQAYYRGAVGCLLVYDISNRQSYTRLPIWLKEITDNALEEIIVMIIGNKTDLGSTREVTTEEGKSFAKQNNYIFLETSALEGTNVVKTFDELVHIIYDKQNHPILKMDYPKIKLNSSHSLKLDTDKPCEC